MFEDIKNGDIESAKLAIANGSDVNAKDKFGATPLDSAVYDEHKEIDELLIVSGANANAKDIVELLISKGANVNAKDENEMTPLYIAIEEGHTETATTLRKTRRQDSLEL